MKKQWLDENFIVNIKALSVSASIARRRPCLSDHDVNEGKINTCNTFSPNWRVKASRIREKQGVKVIEILKTEYMYVPTLIEK